MHLTLFQGSRIGQPGVRTEPFWSSLQLDPNTLYLTSFTETKGLNTL